MCSGGYGMGYRGHVPSSFIPFKKLYSRSRYSNKAVTVLMRQYTSTMELSISIGGSRIFGDWFLLKGIAGEDLFWSTPQNGWMLSSN